MRVLSRILFNFSKLNRYEMSTDSVAAVKRKIECVNAEAIGIPKRNKKAPVEDIIEPVDKHTDYNETEYYFEGCLRKVYPYPYEYASSTKGRWVNSKLIDVMKREFRALPEKTLTQRLETGLTRVNGKLIPVDYVLKNNDYVTSRVHRHEMSVLASKIKIIHESDDVLVVDKPPSMPVHPCGRYRYNSLIVILKKEYGYGDMYIVHRLDRLTSGLLILAKKLEAAQKLTSQIQDRSVEKEYLCRVDGDFPEEEITVDQPIQKISHKIGLSIVDPAGKQSVTKFKKISFNGKTSLVHCFPRTGRMHQIRVHLQYLGFPIANDPLYNSFAYGPEKGKGGNYGKSKEELVEALTIEHSVENWVETEESKLETVDKSDCDLFHEDLLQKEIGDRSPKFDATKLILDKACEDCKKTYIIPQAKDLLIYLHALRYKGDNWDYKSDAPFWAHPDWTH